MAIDISKWNIPDKRLDILLKNGDFRVYTIITTEPENAHLTAEYGDKTWGGRGFEVKKPIMIYPLEGKISGVLLEPPAVRFGSQDFEMGTITPKGITLYIKDEKYVINYESKEKA